MLALTAVAVSLGEAASVGAEEGAAVAEALLSSLRLVAVFGIVLRMMVLLALVFASASVARTPVAAAVAVVAAAPMAVAFCVLFLFPFMLW
jgi:hypothetical protein